MTLDTTGPIGIFDSGVGGLTVAKAITQALPKEHILYFGDTAHLPYGDKSAETIQGYCHVITEYLLQQQCKIIVIACNSASASAFEYIKDYVGTKAHVLNVIDPTVAHIHKHFKNKQVGLIGTKQTILSDSYNQKLKQLGSTQRFITHATPLLVPVIEEGLGEHDIMKEVLALYLSQPKFEQLDAMVLGCTHYPVIQNRIKACLGNNVTILDACTLMANEVKQVLDTNQLHHPHGQGEKHFYISDESDYFKKMSQLFFNNINGMTCLPLWR